MMTLVYKSKLIRALTLLIFLSLYIPDTQAGNVVATSLWESEAIPGQVLSVALGDADNDDLVNDLVYVVKHELVIGKITGGKFSKTLSEKSGTKPEFHRVGLGDFDGDGLMEMLVTGFANGRVFTRIYQVLDQKLSLKNDWDTLVVPLRTKDGERLYAQHQMTRGTWQDRAVRFEFKDDRWQENAAEFIVLHRGLDAATTSLLEVSSSADDLIKLDDSGKLDHEQNQKHMKSSLSYGGAVDFTMISEVDPLGMSRESRLFINPRFVTDAEHVVIAKNEGLLGSAVGAVPSIKSGEVCVLKKTPAGFVEEAVSLRISGAITDVNFTDFDHDGVNELLISVIVGGSGFFDVGSGAASVIAVMPVPIAR